MAYDAQNNDFAYAAIDHDATKIRLEHTTDKWETAKTVTKKLSYVLLIGLILYGFWLAWGVFFIIAFLASLPFTYFPARKLVKIPLRWFFQIDVKQPRFNIFGVPKSWSWSGEALPATDNADNSISIVRTINTEGFHKVRTTMSSGDFDRLEFLNDAKTLDRVVEDKEQLTARLHYMKRNFWNNVISTLTRMQEASIAKPIYELLRKETVDLSFDSVGKSPQTKPEVEKDDE